MFLVKKTRELAIWFYQVFKTFLKVRPALSLVVVVISVTAKITNMIAFLLPLKVILLAGSDGVPRYFRFFVDPEQKLQWIVILSLVAIVAYIVTLILESLDRRFCENGAEAMVSYSNQMAVMANQAGMSFKVFSGFTGLAADISFIFAGMVLVGLLLPTVAQVFLSLALAFYLLSAILLRDAGGQAGAFIPRTAVQKWIGKKDKQYVSILTSVTFLSSFLVILYPYVVGEGPNIIISLIAFIVLRKVIGSISGLIGSAVKLSKDKINVNSLVFRRFQVDKTQKTIHRVFEENFHKSRRDQILDDEVKNLLGEGWSVDTVWEDSPSPGIRRFRFTRDNRAGTEVLHWQVHFPKFQHLLEREEFLFEHLDRNILKAPVRVLDFPFESFRNQVLDIGAGIPVTANEFKAMADDLHDYYRCLTIPKELIRAFRLTEPLLDQKLRKREIENVRVALDTPAEANLYRQFTKKMPEITQRLAALPLILSNPGVSDRHTYWADESKSQILVELWRKWTLVPMGADLRNEASVNDLMERLPALQSRRKEFSGAAVNQTNLMLASLAARLVEAVEGSQFKKALELMREMLLYTEK